NNFSNSGTISSNNGEAIYLGNTEIKTFSNSGTIKSNSGHGINIASATTIDNFNNSGYIEGKGDSGVNIQGGAIKTFTNSGTIQDNSGIVGAVFVSGNIATFKNTGIISGKSSGLFAMNNITTLINSGTIISTSTTNETAGIKLESGKTIANIINTGTIQSKNIGIAVSYGKFGTLTIEDGGIVYGKIAGINVGQWQTLGDLYINGGKNTKKDATVSGIYGDTYGILLGTGSSTQKINLSNGVIQGNINGIKLDSSASLSGDMILSGK
ncbi:hypothetical protein ACOTV8_09475, partial [Campylobacter jejuni]